MSLAACPGVVEFLGDILRQTRRLSESISFMNRYSTVEHFADGLRLRAGLNDTAATDRLLDAFCKVPLEAFAGSGPWRVQSPLAPQKRPITTPDAHPCWLYHDMLVVLDETKEINIGQPSMWARFLANSDIQDGARILQVGAGVGYYTSILSHIAGPDGNVFAYDIEVELAQRASSNLAGYTNVTVRHGNAATDLSDEVPFDVVVAFAGVTHIPNAWSKHLAPKAKLLLPLTGTMGSGAMILAQPDDDGFCAKTLGRCGFYHCSGVRDDKLAAEIDKMFANTERLEDWQFRITKRDETWRFVTLL